MSWTYDVTSDAGKVRLLCQDNDTNNQIFQDAEIQAFLDMSHASILLAAALALEQIAASEVFIQKRIKSLDLLTDGPMEADALRAIAASLRAQEDTGNGDWAGGIDWAETVVNPFTYRDRLINEALREDDL